MTASDAVIDIDGLTSTAARRLVDIGDALGAGGIDVVAFIDARRFEFDPARCASCNRVLEAGHCYHCWPVWGYSGMAK